MQKLGSIYIVEDETAARMMMLDFLEQYKGVELKGFVTAGSLHRRYIIQQSIS